MPFFLFIVFQTIADARICGFLPIILFIVPYLDGKLNRKLYIGSTFLFSGRFIF